MTIVTTGNKYIDIDGLACVIAYEELLRKSGKDTSHYLYDSFTESIPQIVKDFGYTPNFEKPLCTEKTRFVVVDVSEPQFLPDIINIERIDKILDHHFGFEKFWEEKLGENSIIREIGACATLVYQEWLKAGLLPSISQVSANLLITAIISNSLNFQASVTKDDDKEAYKALLEYASLSTNWTEVYFSTVSTNIYKNPVLALQKDTKTFNFSGKPLNIGQLEVWDSSKIINQSLASIIEHLKNEKYRGFVTIADISNGYNSIICIDEEIQQLLRNKLGFNFRDNLYTTDILYLRKELVRAFFD